MINKTQLRTIDRGTCDLINSHDGLWREIGELARTMEYVLIEDPFMKLLCQLDVIENNVGITSRTRELRRNLISIQYPA